MLITANHGQKIEPFNGGGATFAARSSAAVTSEVVPVPADLAPSSVSLAAAAVSPDRFGYMFNSGGIPETANAFEKLDTIGTAMLDEGAVPGPSGLPAVLTYFGQFVDHDITANTDRNPDAMPSFSIVANPLPLNSRDAVRQQLGNLRRGTLRLDSVYGDGTPLDAKLRDGATMRVGKASGGQDNDLPRFGAMVDAGVIAASDLPDTSQMHSSFGPVDPRKLAFIGDGRNDENLVVAQLHLAFLRFHNAVAAQLPGSDDERFARARQLTRWHYQWLVVERYLRRVCDPAVLDGVIARAPGRYATFAAANGGVSADHAPLPVEFSVAAFRFGHSMIRDAYVFNKHFRPADVEPLADRIGDANLRELFQFTGRGGMIGSEQLPDVWIIDWRNFIDDATENRMAQPIDPVLAKALGNMENEDTDHLRSLAQRNLRRSYVLNLPTAQTVAALLSNEGIDVDFLSTDEITQTPGGAEILAQGFETLTPLWFYILAEARVRAQSRHLGPLGSLIVAETLVGLISIDPESYWHAPGAAGRWSPADAGLGAPIDSFEAFFQFAGVLA